MRRRDAPLDGTHAHAALVRPETRDRIQQAPRVGVQGLGVQRGDIGDLDEFARVQHQRAVAGTGENAEVVADVQHRRAPLADQVADEVQHGGLGGGIQGRGRLVEDQEPWIGGEGHGDHDALEHPAAGLVGVGARHAARVGQAHRREDISHASLGVGAGQAPAHLKGLGHLLAEAQARVQRREGVLRHQRQARPPDAHHLPRVEIQEAAPLEGHRARTHGARRGEVAHDGQGGRGLARPRLADQAARLAGQDVKGEVADRLDPAAAVPIGHREAVDVERRHIGIRRHRLPQFRRRAQGSLSPSAIRFTPTTSAAIAPAG